MCLGARIAKNEARLLLSRLFRNYRIELEPNQNYKMESFLMIKADPFPKFNLIQRRD